MIFKHGIQASTKPAAPGATTPPGTAMSNSNPKIEALKKRQAEILARIEQVQAMENAKRRKEDTRLKILIGAALLADTTLHPETRAGVLAVLRRAITAPRDVQFLQSKDWWL
jgi:hypothetical protein